MQRNVGGPFPRGPAGIFIPSSSGKLTCNDLFRTFTVVYRIFMNLISAVGHSFRCRLETSLSFGLPGAQKRTLFRLRQNILRPSNEAFIKAVSCSKRHCQLTCPEQVESHWYNNSSVFRCYYVVHRCDVGEHSLWLLTFHVKRINRVAD